ncbi:hypothetical protein [Streptomyces sp. A1-5]|uniref:hypothetical protein n=1 Tax=Streptomyces sp. A1-5 TaxID=2738410 RepID=UPI001F39EE98|nr:hypothetical protein [Streptomyces sp. A1-5]UJB39481.1 hypothetical protein HRD51_09950 [Streptomyces sp. A1-5]
MLQDLSAKKDIRVGDWAAVKHVELAHKLTDSSWLIHVWAHAADEHRRDIVKGVAGRDGPHDWSGCGDIGGA